MRKAQPSVERLVKMHPCLFHYPLITSHLYLSLIYTCRENR